MAKKKKSQTPENTPKENNERAIKEGDEELEDEAVKTDDETQDGDAVKLKVSLLEDERREEFKVPANKGRVVETNSEMRRTTGIEIRPSPPGRRRIRYGIMRILNKNYDGPASFKKEIDSQLEELNLEWEDFRKTWDITTKPPYEVGKFDKL